MSGPESVFFFFFAWWMSFESLGLLFNYSCPFMQALGYMVSAFKGGPISVLLYKSSAQESPIDVGLLLSWAIGLVWTGRQGPPSAGASSFLPYRLLSSLSLNGGHNRCQPVWLGRCSWF